MAFALYKPSAVDGERSSDSFPEGWWVRAGKISICVCVCSAANPGQNSTQDQGKGVGSESRYLAAEIQYSLSCTRKCGTLEQPIQTQISGLFSHTWLLQEDQEEAVMWMAVVTLLPLAGESLLHLSIHIDDYSILRRIIPTPFDIISYILQRNSFYTCFLDRPVSFKAHGYSRTIFFFFFWAINVVFSGSTVSNPRKHIPVLKK